MNTSKHKSRYHSLCLIHTTVFSLYPLVYLAFSIYANSSQLSDLNMCIVHGRNYVILTMSALSSRLYLAYLMRDLYVWTVWSNTGLFGQNVFAKTIRYFTVICMISDQKGSYKSPSPPKEMQTYRNFCEKKKKRKKKIWDYTPSRLRIFIFIVR